MRSKSLRLKHLSRIDSAALARAGASRYLISSIRRHPQKPEKYLSPKMRKRAERVYRQVNYQRLKAAGYSRPDRYRYWNDTPRSIENLQKRIDKCVRIIVDVNRVVYERKKGLREAVRAVRKCLAMKEWPVSDIEQYVRQMLDAGPSLWREYSTYKKQHGYIQYTDWQQVKAREMLFKKE